MTPPYDLQQIYNALIHSTLGGYPFVYADKEYSLEEIANITYYRVIQHTKAADVVVSPMYTAVTRPFTAEDAESVCEALKKSSIIGSTYLHRSKGKVYVVVVCDRSNFSLLSLISIPEYGALKKNPFIVPSKHIYVLQLLSPISEVPNEIFLSRAPTRIILLLNTDVEEEKLTFYLHQEYEGVLEIVYESNHNTKVVLVLFDTVRNSSILYQNLLGRTINTRNVLIGYYPQELYEIKIYPGKKYGGY